MLGSWMFLKSICYPYPVLWISWKEYVLLQFLSMSVHMNVWVKTKSSSLFLESKVPREIESFPGRGRRSTATVMIFSSYLGGYWKCVLPLHTQCLCLKYLLRGSLSVNTLPKGSSFIPLNMLDHVQGINLFIKGQNFICHRYSCYCLVEDDLYWIHMVGGILIFGSGFCLTWSWL